ncbi:MAG: hypothetical protein LBC89_04520 [Bacteroidales bacterium]|jgi:hypothetical protein|nr:hypothetical protein [Bacteroidales bacterium]
MKNTWILILMVLTACFCVSCDSWLNGGSTTYSHWFSEEKGCVEFKNISYTDSHSITYSNKDTAGVIYFSDYGKKFRSEIHHNGMLVAAVVLDYNKNKCISIDYRNTSYNEEPYQNNDALYWANVFEYYGAGFYITKADTIAEKLCIVKAREFQYQNQNVYEKIAGWGEIKFSYVSKLGDSLYRGYRAVSFSPELPSGIFDIPAGFTKQ